MESNFNINSISIIFLVNAFVALALAFITNYRKDISGIRYVTAMSLMVFIWSFSNALEFATTDIQLKILFTKFSYLGIAPAPLTLLVFAAHRTGLTRKVALRSFHLLYLFPIAIIILAFTNDLHFFHWKSYKIVDGIGGQAVYYESGVGLWMLVVFSWLTFIIAMILMINLFRNRKKRFNKPLILVLLAFIWPWIANFLYVGRFLPHPEIDWTPVAYMITASLLFYSVRKYHLFDLAPLAKDLLFSSIQNPVVVLNAKKNLIDFNYGAETQFGKSLKIGEKYQCFLPELEQDDFSKYINSKITLRRKNEDKTCWFELSISEIASTDHHTEGYLLLFVDITQVKNQHKELELLNQEKDKLFSILAHDLRNPFHGIIGLSKILVDDPDIVADQKVLILEGIHRTAQNTYALLENLLAWAKSQTNTVQFKPEALDLNEIIQTSIREVITNAEFKDISLNSQVEKGIKVFADKNMLTAILRNLLSNAIKFTPRSGRISILHIIQEENIIVSVRDSGIGMDAITLRQLFSENRFHSLSGTENEKGTGLGLIICKDLVGRHKGQLWAESKPGRGTTFSFSIPINQSKS